MDSEKETALCKALVCISEDSVVEELRKCDKWNGQEVPNFWADMEEKKSKRYKSAAIVRSTRRSLNTTTRDEEDEAEDSYQKKEKKDEAEEVRRSHPIRKDQAKRKEKVVTSSRSSTTSFDVEALAKLIANQYVMTNDPYNATKGMSENSRMQK
ncbi:hypothetical protein Tco_0062003 [Tanacetum coccineum]